MGCSSKWAFFSLSHHWVLRLCSSARRARQAWLPERRAPRWPRQLFHGKICDMGKPGCFNLWTYFYVKIPVVPHKAVAEVSKIGNYRRKQLLWCMDGRANPLMDRKVVEALNLSLSTTLSVTFSLCLSISPSVYLSVYLSISGVV